jgi:hypothetical protein
LGLSVEVEKAASAAKTSSNSNNTGTDGDNASPEEEEEDVSDEAVASRHENGLKVCLLFSILTFLSRNYQASFID